MVRLATLPCNHFIWWPRQRRLVKFLYHIAVLSTIIVTCTAQKTTATSTETKTVDLPFGDINVLVVTDVHSWVGGHSSNEPNHNADYGDVLSFYQRLRAHCQANNMDLWFVMNGDWIDGTGLSLNGDISYLTPLLERMPWDAVNVGNHELYRDEVVNEFMRPGGFVEWWSDRYLSSNVLHTQRQEPLGNRYRFLRGTNATVLTFGFLYNMENASPVVTVETVQKVVEDEWFFDVITNAEKVPHGYYDAIMVLAHMDVKDELVTVLLDKIRSLVGPTMPVQFITGHTHYRGVHTMDEASVSFEAGRYLDTIGFVSFPKQQTLQKLSRGRMLQNKGSGNENEGESPPPLLGPGGTEWPNVSDTNTSSTVATVSPTTASVSTSTPSPTLVVAAAAAAGATETNATPPTNESLVAVPTPTPTTAPQIPKSAILFHQMFIDTEVATLEAIIGVPELSTDDGSRLSDFIFRTRKELGLLELIGCTEESYYINRSVTAEDSLWRIFLEEVAPYRLLKPTTNQQQHRVFLGSMGAFRYDLLGRALIVDDVIAVAPYNETIYSLGPNVSGAVLTELIANVLNTEPNDENPLWDNFAVSPHLEDLKANVQYEIMAPEWGLQQILDGLKKTNYSGEIQKSETGLTTTDIWLEYVKENWVCRDEDVLGGIANINDNPNSNDNTGSSSSGGTDGVHSGIPYNQVDQQEDKKRLIMAGVGVGIVLLLGSLYIYQLHESWLRRYRARQRLILLADQEHDNELI